MTEAEYKDEEKSRREELKQLNGFSDEKTFQFMIRAIFFHLYKGFDFDQFEMDFAKRRMLKALMSKFPGTSREWQELKVEEKRLAKKVDEALAGENLSAYMPKSKKGE